MKILEQNNTNTYFLVKGERISPFNLSKDNLLDIMTEMYNTSEDILIPSNEIINNIKNPIEKDIVEQIVNKISDFKDNINNIKHEVETQFPKINE
ncbi:hypothetical protein I5C05_10350 [Staphylococcus aureus]|uniref:hypothetical protein n=1 Tax=Staphylococcus aureus TaxID=1280 RepID=UPI000BA1B422|nr:hypothetical protein [Staphylococcus aureus]AVO70358.1 hypothetical protein C6V85_14510 [Staphylococcus aureus]MCC2080601.1 hypothetical protein [Staphylococcus aureus]MCD0508836.1 hypothetical protein [Staphylococcus aureus]MCD0530732.1 hypothetical protein [Staphylococcus aureus]MCD0536143.1 hypothetical protein [Staphylococcus aureus]